MPNPPPNCIKPEPPLGFSRAGETGTASFAGGRLVQVTVRSSVADRAQGDARIRDVRKSAGEPFRTTDKVVWRWRDATTDTSAELDHILPEDSWSFSENYVKRHLSFEADQSRTP
jgi:hypothetical protein